MELNINSTQQMCDFRMAQAQMKRLCDAVENMNSLRANRAAFECFKADKSAETRYNESLHQCKSKVETELDFLNAALLSLGLETITIKY